jgi:phosphoribosylanthranilate isomerase
MPQTPAPEPPPRPPGWQGHAVIVHAFASNDHFGFGFGDGQYAETGRRTWVAATPKGLQAWDAARMVKQTHSKEVTLRIKICGITNPTDARLAADLGADAIGVNFYARSKRHVDEASAAAIVRTLPPFVEGVGLFVNLPLAEVFPLMQRVAGLRTIQWHGDRHEPCPPTSFRFIPAFQVGDAGDLARVTNYLEACQACDALPAAVLLDGQVAGQYGGTGQRAPWQLLAEFRAAVPVILAGGLTPENVAEAIRLVRPYAVDVASGVESAPGRKDAEKMRRFVAHAREAAAGLGLP